MNYFYYYLSVEIEVIEGTFRLVIAIQVSFYLCYLFDTKKYRMTFVDLSLNARHPEKSNELQLKCMPVLVCQF